MALDDFLQISTDQLLWYSCILYCFPLYIMPCCSCLKSRKLMKLFWLCSMLFSSICIIAKGKNLPLNQQSMMMMCERLHFLSLGTMRVGHQSFPLPSRLPTDSVWSVYYPFVRGPSGAGILRQISVKVR